MLTKKIRLDINLASLPIIPLEGEYFAIKTPYPEGQET